MVSLKEADYMTMALSPRLKDAIRKMLDDIEGNGSFLNAYKCAAQIQMALPDENVDLEDIVAAMLAGRGGIQVIEFDPPALIIDFILPLPDEEKPEPREPTVCFDLVTS
jgi:hypothetical protein